MRTKIIATLGPASGSPEMIKKLAAAGMDIARINFSHATEAQFVAWKKSLKAAERLTKRKIPVMQDLQGPRLRIGELPPEGRTLKEHEIVTFSVRKNDGDAIYIDHPNLHKDISKGDPIYLANGDFELVTRRIAGERIIAEVVRGGILYSRKGVNLPVTQLSNTGLTAKDVRDVKLALKHGVDLIAISFVQSGRDVQKLRAIVRGRAKIVAKIETAVAVQNFDEILRAADAVMVARGDLGIEMPVEQLPFIQKNLIHYANWHGKAVITATQMLMSMVNHPHPTRAEVSDIANAILDGSDAVMLSDETASGKYPVESVRMMARVAAQTERLHFERPNPFED